MDLQSESVDKKVSSAFIQTQPLSEDAYQHNTLSTDLGLYKALYNIDQAPVAFKHLFKPADISDSDSDSGNSEYFDALMVQPNPTTDVTDRKSCHCNSPTFTTHSPCANPLQVPPEEGSTTGEGENGGVQVLQDGHCDSFQALGVEPVLQPRTLMMLNKQSVKSSTWIVDSGANICIVNDKELFTDFRALSYKIGTADDQLGISVQGGGKVTLSLCVDGEETADLELTSVAYAPSARCNILSLSWIAETSGLKGSWDKARMTIAYGDQVIGVAPLIDGLYQLQIFYQPDTGAIAELEDNLVMVTNDSDDSSSDSSDSPPSEDANDSDNQSDGVSSDPEDAEEEDSDALPAGVVPPEVVSITEYDDHPLWLAHRKLGHLGFANMRLLLKMSTGLDIADDQIKIMIGRICPVCAQAKAVKRIPKDPAKRRAKKLGELIHVDGWGPYHLASWNGNYSILGFTDDATRMSWSVAYSNKDQLLVLFRDMHNRLERRYNIKIRAYRMDNELPGYGIFTDWTRKHGITLEPGVSGSHHMNGVAERGFRTEREKAASIMQDNDLSDRIKGIIKRDAERFLEDSALPKMLWTEAFKHALWLKNRSPTRALKNKKTP